MVKLLLLLGAATAFAQPVVTRGGALKKRAYQTYGTISLFVDGTLGSDSNPCTASGASACATWAGAMTKVPRFIRHAVNITIAAGTYNEQMRFTGFTVSRDPTTATTPTITVTGALGAPTLTTGTASGTLTAFAAASGTTLALATDSTQSWTVNELRGSMLTIGANNIPIVSNTATTISLAVTASLSAGNAYTITTPSVIFSQATGPAFLAVGNMGGGGNFNINNVRWNATTGAVLQLSQNTLSFGFTRITAVGTAALFTADGNMRSLTFTNAYLTSSSASAICMVDFLRSAVTITNSYLRASGSGAIALCQSGTNNYTSVSGHLEANPTSEAVYEFFNGTNSNSQNTVTIFCTNSAGIGLYAPHPGETSQGAGGIHGFSKLAVKDCPTAVSLVSPIVISSNSVAITTATTGISVTRRAAFNFRSTAPTFTTVTNELQADSVNYTYSFFSGLSPSSIVAPSGAALVNW
jgi:hypothetical protein